jgi:hypothetical protein
MDSRIAREQIAALYDARSCIVHEGATLTSEFSKKSTRSKKWRRVGDTVETFDAAMVDIVRRILIAIVARAGALSSASDFRQRLEDSVLFDVPFPGSANAPASPSFESAPGEVAPDKDTGEIEGSGKEGQESPAGRFP